MKSTSKWYLLAPALAVVLILGPLSMQGSSGKTQQPATEPAPTAAAANAAPQPADTTAPNPRAIVVPKSPDMLQMLSALLGVLLLGAGGIYALRRLRGGAVPTKGAPLMTLRQTLRLTTKQAVHAIEFDERILLVGESDRGLVLIESGRSPERAADEREVLTRTLPQPIHDDDDGAVPKDLVIPRPDRQPVRNLPQRPLTPASAPESPLGSFRALLQKAGRA